MVDVTTGYVPGPGGFYKQSDRSGPYTIDSNGNILLLGSGQGVAASSVIGPITGTLAKAGDVVTLSAPGACNYLIQIIPGSPNLIGTIATSDLTTSGSRRLFKTGVGPLEVSSESLDGTQGSLEYRCSGGGDGLKVALSAYTSGSATVKIWATFDPTMVFINGPVHTTLEAAIRAGRGFKVGGAAQIAAGNVLNFILSNPGGSGRNVFLMFRRFIQTSANIIQYQQFINPTQFNSSVAALTIGNRRNDSTMTPVAVAKIQMATAVISTGTAGAIGYIATNAMADELEIVDMLAPNTSIGYSFTGVGGGLFSGAAANLSFLFSHIEEGIV